MTTPRPQLRRRIHRWIAVGAISCCFFAPAGARAAATGLVAAYSFNEGTGTTLADLSGNGNTGTLTSTSWSSAGRFGGALSFNGSSSWVTVNDSSSLHLGSGMTLEAWVRPTATMSTLWKTVVIKQQTGDLVYALYANSDRSSPDGIVYAGGAERDAYGASSLALNTWTHLAASYDGATVRLYVNGTQVSSTAYSGTILSSTAPLRIGGNSVWGEYFQGLIDEVRVYNRALSAAEIQTDMNTPVAASPDTQAPSAPSGLTTSGATGTSVTLGWTTSTDNVGVTGYNVYRDGTKVGSTSAASFAFGSLSCGTTYTLGVEAYDAAGNVSTRSTANGSTAACPDTTPPSPPAAFTVTGSTATSVSASWAASSDNVAVTGYNLYRDGLKVGSTAGTGYTFGGLACGTVYLLEVEAYDAAGNLSTRSALNATPAPCDTSPPTAPTSFTATGATASSISTTWTASTDDVGVTGYNLYSGGAKAGTATATGYTFGGLACGTTYTLEVEAYDGAGNLSPRTSLSASTNVCDTTSPSISVTSPAAGATVSGTVSVTADAGDDVGVAGVQFTLDGASLGAEATAPPYSVSWDTTKTTNSTHTLAAVARDAAGNRTTSASVTVTVANPLDTSNAFKRVVIGPGYVDATTRQVVRTAGGVVYVFTADDTAERNGTGPGVIHAWKGSPSGIPTSFAEADGAHRPSATGSTNALESPDVRLDANGVARMVYVNESTATLVYQTFSTTTDTWGPAETVASGVTVNTRFIRRGVTTNALALDANDVPHIVYVANGAVLYRNRIGGAWSSPLTLATSATPVHPMLAFDGAGALHLAWLNDGTSPAVMYKARAADGIWGATETVANTDVLTNSNTDQGPSIVVTQSGKPYVLYVSAISTSAVRVKYRTANGWVLDTTPYDAYTHTPQIYSRGDDVYVFLGHDVDIDYAYMYHLLGQPWSSLIKLTNIQADGSASIRWDPFRDNNPNVIDTAFYNENSTGTNYIPQAYYMAALPQTSSGGDTTAPAVSVTGPAAGATVSGSTTVTADASDNVGVTGVQFTLDGASLGAEDTSAPYSVTWDTTSAANGSHVLAAVARDAAGNRTTAASVTVNVSNAAPPPPPPPSTGLVAAYGFNEGSGTTTADLSGTGNTGTLTSTTWTTAGRFGSALSFNGSSSWVTVNDASSLDLTTAMTLEAWVYPTALSAWRTLLIKQQTGQLVYALYANTDTNRPSGHVYIGGDIDTRGTVQMPLNTWTHLAATYDGTTLRLYVNGTLVSSRAVSGSMPNSTGPLRIGGNSVWGEYFSGRIDEVRVYKRALSAAEVQSDMTTPVK